MSQGGECTTSSVQASPAEAAAIIAASCVALVILLALSFFAYQGKLYSQRRCTECGRRCKKNKIFFQATYRDPKTKEYKIRRWWLGAERGHCQDCRMPGAGAGEKHSQV